MKLMCTCSFVLIYMPKKEPLHYKAYYVHYYEILTLCNVIVLIIMHCSYNLFIPSTTLNVRSKNYHNNSWKHWQEIYIFCELLNKEH